MGHLACTDPEADRHVLAISNAIAVVNLRLAGEDSTAMAERMMPQFNSITTEQMVGFIASAAVQLLAHLRESSA